MADKRDAKKLPALITGIKLEPGTFDAPPGRLPSFGGRRDLTLGSSGKVGQGLETKSKRVYTPNFNVQRNKNKTDGIKEEHPNSKDKKDRNKNDGKGRKREKTNNFIQLGGVFSEGVAGKTKVSSGRGGGGGGGGGGDKDPSNSFIAKPKLNLQHDKKIDKDEEDMKLKELLRDNFVDDPGMEPDQKYAPIKLPMLSIAKIKSEVKAGVKEEVKTNKMEIAGVKIKQEILDEDEQDVKPKLENGLLADTGTGADTVKMKLPDDLEVCELFESKDPQLIFLQLPDCLPGLKPEDDRAHARPTTSAKPSASETEQSTSANSSENAEIPKHCILKSLSEGCVGKLQILKSGRAKLVFGDVVMNLDMGTQVGFRQDLISVDLEHSSKGGDMINLGPVKTHMVCTPDWESMLSQPVK
ncbi:hypothetical protein L9F63_004926 [Diploptera punctata]|uniref:DNA-directed RNA polymerase III subunit RPC4 n=1 Tax=Diploptera punctata TaxID=6984 RepID=A0AAD7ZEU2_DIPPU|nr:hypothetical protein L9F63_004926 [Diploptera punctata]